MPGLVAFLAGRALPIGGDLDCAKKIFDKTGVSNYRQVKVADLDVAKGSGPATQEQVEAVVHKIKDELAAT